MEVTYSILTQQIRTYFLIQMLYRKNLFDLPGAICKGKPIGTICGDLP